MDITRYSLYTSLAIATYLLLLAWQEDYPPVIESNDVVQSLPQVTDNSISVPEAASDSAPADVPVAVPSQSSTPPPAAAVQVASNADSEAGEIEIVTDSLDLRINLAGGDITYLALPRHLRQLDVPDDPFVLLETGPARSYVANSGLIGRDGIDSDGRALYSSSATRYEMAGNEDTLEVDLNTRTPSGVLVTKRFTFTRDSNLIDITFFVDNQSGADWQGNAYGQIRRTNFDDPSEAGGFGARSYLGFVTTNDDDPYIEVELEDIDEGSSSHDMMGGWIGFSQHYFISAWVPPADNLNRFTTRPGSNGQYYGEFSTTALNVPQGETGQITVQYYAGPKDQYTLADISPNLDLTIDYSFLWFIAAPIYWLLTRIDSFVNNYGFSIILLTLIVKGVFYKLTEAQYRSMAAMRKLMPRLQQLKESYGDDRMKLQQATMELYKKEKINPLGGCLPLLVQMPVFIALYWVLMESVELRHAPFIFWINDLSVRDPFFVLPLLMAATMFLQTRLSPAPADPMQAQVMKIMPIMMGILFLWFPAGLVLYWFTNGALGILQQWYITRKIEAEA